MVAVFVYKNRASVDGEARLHTFFFFFLTLLLTEEQQTRNIFAVGLQMFFGMQTVA